VTVVLAATAAALFGVGTYLIFQRKLSRIIIGVGLFSHGANVLLISSGRAGLPPLIGLDDPETFADPLPQSLVLTAIVISFGVTALLLALAYRSWQLTRDDEVVDDVEDRAIAAEGAADVELDDAEAPLHPDPGETEDEVLAR
jgi:multicomponent Na+:H+ antiporter subunit C